MLVSKNTALHKEKPVIPMSQICYGIEYVNEYFMSVFASKYCSAIIIITQPYLGATHLPVESARGLLLLLRFWRQSEYGSQLIVIVI